MAEQTTSSIVIDAAPAAVMGVISDFEAYPSWAQGVKKAEPVDAGKRPEQPMAMFDEQIPWAGPPGAERIQEHVVAVCSWPIRNSHPRVRCCDQPPHGNQRQRHQRKRHRQPMRPGVRRR